MPELVDALRTQRVLPILRGTDSTALAQVAGAVVDGGARTVELTMTSPDAAGDVRRLRSARPDALIGVGTVTAAEQVGPLAEAGADFLVTPVVALPVLAACADRGLPVVVGALTPTEVLAASVAGAAAVKIFPAGRLGAGYLSDLAAVLPDVPLVPTGGIGKDEVAAYLARGAVAVGLGSSLTGPALAGDGAALEALPGRVAALLAAARA